MSLKTQVTEVVQKQKDVAAEVQEKLDRCDVLEKTVAELRQLLDGANRELGEAKQKVKSLEALIEREEKLVLREEAVSAREQKLNVEEELIACRLDNANQRVEDHKAMFSVVFRNTIVRSKLSVEVQGADTKVYYGDGSAAMQNSGGFVHEADSTQEAE